VTQEGIFTPNPMTYVYRLFGSALDQRVAFFPELTYSSSEELTDGTARVLLTRGEQRRWIHATRSYFCLGVGGNDPRLPYEVVPIQGDHSVYYGNQFGARPEGARGAVFQRGSDLKFGITRWSSFLGKFLTFYSTTQSTPDTVDSIVPDAKSEHELKLARNHFMDPVDDQPVTMTSGFRPLVRLKQSPQTGEPTLHDLSRDYMTYIKGPFSWLNGVKMGDALSAGSDVVGRSTGVSPSLLRKALLKDPLFRDTPSLFFGPPDSIDYLRHTYPGLNSRLHPDYPVTKLMVLDKFLFSGTRCPDRIVEMLDLHLCPLPDRREMLDGVRSVMSEFSRSF